MSFTPAPQPVGDGIWVVERKLRMPPALTLPSRMTVIRLPSRGLLLCSPVHVDAGLTAALSSLGEVEVVLAPNSFHYLFAPEYVRPFPRATFFLAPGLRERVPSLPAGADVTDAPPWAGSVEHLVIGPLRGLSEVALFHRPTATLVLTDLAFNLPSIEGVYNSLIWRLMGVPPGFGPSRSARLTLLRDRVAVRPFLSRVEDWPFERIIVAHGDIVERDAQAVFHAAFSRYLP